MGNFNRSFNRDSRPNGGSGRFDRSTRDREMHRTTCSNCGKECEVPFKPTGAKPVFCSDCFEKNGGEQRRSNDRDYSQRRPNFDSNRNFERPQYNDRPRYEDRPQSSERPQQNNDQFASLNAKLDRIITLLTPKPEHNNAPLETASPEDSTQKTEKKPRAPRKPKSVPAESEE